MTSHVQFFFCVSKGKEGRRKQHRQVYVRLPLPLPLSISHVVLFTSKPISHACILCVFHRCQASVTFVCVCAFFFFLSPLCRIAVATPRFFFLFFFFQKKKKKRDANNSDRCLWNEEEGSLDTFQKYVFFFLNGADVFNHLFFFFALFFFLNLPVWISDVHFTDLQPSSLILLFSSA